MRTRVNLYVPDHRLLEAAESLHINMSQLFAKALAEAIERRREEVRHDAFMATARTGSIDGGAY